jgi:hypothetical protein
MNSAKDDSECRKSESDWRHDTTLLLSTEIGEKGQLVRRRGVESDDSTVGNLNRLHARTMVSLHHQLPSFPPCTIDRRKKHEVARAANDWSKSYVSAVAPAIAAELQFGTHTHATNQALNDIDPQSRYS